MFSQGMAHLAQNIGEDGVGVKVGVDSGDGAGEAGDGGSETLANSFLIRFRPTFDTVAGSFHTALGGLAGNIQQEGQVRHESRGGGVADSPDLGGVNSTCQTLVNHGGEKESVSDHAFASFKCRHDLLGQKLCPAGHEHEHFGARATFDAVAVQQKASESITEGSAARVAYGDDFKSILTKTLGETGGLSGFAGPIGSVEADKNALRSNCGAPDQA